MSACIAKRAVDAPDCVPKPPPVKRTRLDSAIPPRGEVRSKVGWATATETGLGLTEQTMDGRPSRSWKKHRTRHELFLKKVDGAIP